MKKREKILSLLIVMLIVGINALTACGPNPTVLEKNPSPQREVVLSKYIPAEKTGNNDEPNEPKPETETKIEPEASIKAKADSDSAKPADTSPSDQSIAAKLAERETGKAKDNPFPTAVTAQDFISQACFDSLEEKQKSYEPESAQTVNPELEVRDHQENDEAAQEPVIAGSGAALDEQSLYAGESGPELVAPDQIQCNEPQPQHIHSYTAIKVEPTCTAGGYTVFSCECGERYQEDDTTALGHDWVANTETEKVGQEAHEICGDCGLDLTANGISGAGISAHAKNHVLSDENATGRTYTAMVEVYNDVVRYTCCRCGASQ